MSNLPTKAQNEPVVAPPARAMRPIDSLAALLEAKKESLAQVLPRHVSVDRLVKLSLAAVSRSTHLLECDPQSVFLALWQAAELGLEPVGPMQHCYLIPRKNKNKGGRKEATFMLGYKGMCELARRSGEVEKIDAGVVYEGDGFEFDPIAGTIKHPWSWDVDRSDAKVKGAYAYARLKGVPDPIVTVLDRKQIEKRRSRSMASNDGPWRTDYPEMCRKTAMRSLFASGRVPMSVEVQKQLEREESFARAEIVTPKLGIEVGAYEPPTSDVPAEPDYSEVPELDGPDDMAIVREAGEDG